MYCLWFTSIVVLSVIDGVHGSYQRQDSFKLASFIRRRKLDHCSNVLCETEEDCCVGYHCVKNNLVENLGLCLKSGHNFCLINNDGETLSNPKQCPEGQLCVPFQESLQPLGFCANGLQDLLPKRRYFETCETTIDCDTSRRLCCRVFQPAKGSGRKRCSYYSSPVEECVF